MDKDHTGFHEWHKTQSAKVLFIDSKDATAQHDGTTHFTYVFRDTIQVKKNEGVLVSLLQASIPYSFYNCREGVNDKIDILYGPANATSKTEMVDFVLLIPAGNYTAISLANRIKSLLENYMSAPHPTGPNHDGVAVTMASTITMGYDRDTQKFQFSIVPLVGSANSGDGRIVIFNLSHGQNAQTHFDVEIGFDSETASSSVFFKHDGTNQTAGSVILSGVSDALVFDPTANRTYLESTNIADLNGSVHSLYLRTNLPIISSMASLTGGTSQILAKLPIDVGPGSIIFHEPKNSVHKSLIQTQGIKYITLRLTDDRNRLISLNGLHFSVALMFEFVSLKNYIAPIDPRSVSFIKNNLDNKQNVSRDKPTTKTSNPQRRARQHNDPRRYKKRNSKT